MYNTKHTNMYIPCAQATTWCFQEQTALCSPFWLNKSTSASNSRQRGPGYTGRKVAHAQGSTRVFVSSTVLVEFKFFLAPKPHIISFESLSQTPAEAKVSEFFFVSVPYMCHEDGRTAPSELTDVNKQAWRRPYRFDFETTELFTATSDYTPMSPTRKLKLLQYAVTYLLGVCLTIWHENPSQQTQTSPSSHDTSDDRPDDENTHYPCGRSAIALLTGANGELPAKLVDSGFTWNARTLAAVPTIFLAEVTLPGTASASALFVQMPTTIPSLLICMA